jgi:GNAT superfamily N-acetyltransferase
VTLAAIEIRDACPADLPALRRIYRDASWSNEGDRPLLERHPEFLELWDTAVAEGRSRVAMIAGRPVGFATILTHADKLELEDLFVDPDRMRQGVATALVADAVERARLVGAGAIEVDGNDHALAFYRRVGFVPTGTVTLTYGSATRLRLPISTVGDAQTPDDD